nr:PREDICTED: C-type lectin domain family 2 member E-like isoform X2 [Haliaeetus albicilla]
MKEMRDYSGFWGVERSKRAGYSLEMKPEARVACQVMMMVLFIALLVTAITFAVQAFQPRPQPCFRCPFDWIGYRGKCYYFSEAEGNWTSSQDNCSALGASLAMLDSLEDLSFVIRYKGISEHWIGLSREDEEQPWRWVNHSHLSRLLVTALYNGLGTRLAGHDRAMPQRQHPPHPGILGMTATVKPSCRSRLRPG